MIKLYNTLSKTVEEFVPVTPGKIKMYVCGPTVYNYFHIGNSRVFVVFDVIREYLTYRGYEVTFVQNLTDIEDKIIDKANKEGVTWQEIVERFSRAYFEDTAALKVKRADISPRATDEIDGMLQMIASLIEKGFAYVTKNGVYFSVEKFDGYGKLSHRNIEELMEGARVEVDTEKKNPLDFALWKFVKPGEPSWPSPWGDGRPGWHIECSVMSGKYLDNTFDIHGGGADLIFPHHENEIAQSEACNGVPFVKYWMHAGYMNISGVKMSKSKGNFVMVRDLLQEYMPEVLRMFILSGHYRAPLDFTKENLDAVKTGYTEIYLTFQRLAQRLDGFSGKGPAAENSPFMAEFIEAMDNDFNTAKATAAIYKAVNALKGNMAKMSDEEIKGYANALDTMCGIFRVKPALPEIDADIAAGAEKVDSLRKEKKYEEADKLKAEISEKGYVLEFAKDRYFVLRKPVK